MIPTRDQILETLKNIDPLSEEEKTREMGEWLDTLGCPQLDKEKILDDLNSYNY